MRVCRRVAIVRRQVARLAAVAADRVAQAERRRTEQSFRPLSEAKTEVIVGGDLLTALGAGQRRD